MKTMAIQVVRIYIHESSHQLKAIIDYLKNEAKVRGFTVFRGIKGFGDSGEATTLLVDLSLDLPLVIEFFDSREKIEPALEYLANVIKHEHVITWSAEAND